MCSVTTLGGMLKTELYKIYSKRVIWIAMIVFLGLFLVLKLQFIGDIGVKYTLEPMRSELSAAVANDNFHEFVRNKEYRCSFDEITQFIPQSVVDYGRHCTLLSCPKLYNFRCKYLWTLLNNISWYCLWVLYQTNSWYFAGGLYSGQHYYVLIGFE